MPFSGGGNTPLTNHVHDNNPGEGGALSTTLTLMGPDVLYSLITDNTAQVNANTANIATNTAAIAALPTSTAWNRIVNQTQTGGSANFNVTGLTSTKKYLMFSFAGSFGGFDKLRLRFGSGGSIDTGNNYNWRSGKNGTYSGSFGADTIEIMTANSGGNNDYFVSGFMQLNAASDGSGTADTRIGNLTTTQNDSGAFANIQTSFEWDDSATPVTDIRFYANGGNDIRGTLNIWESQD
tara:strand:- start:53 stop:763 length:711 start_codon:yes stop_codon:yes gene_type:complete